VLIRSDLVSRIHAALVGAGIEIPFPQQDLHLRSVPDGWPGPGEREAPNQDRGGPDTAP
jgi:potassium efflux system protein